MPDLNARASNRRHDAEILAAQPALRSLARKLCPTGGEDAIDDLTSVGNIALIKAVDQYDPLRCTLLAYARPVIEREMRDAIVCYGRKNIAGLAHRRADPIHYEQAEEVADTAASPEELAGASELSDLLNRALSQLTAREHMIIRRRYFAARECSQRELADEMGVSRQLVSAVEVGALEKMKAVLGPQARELLK